ILGLLLSFFFFNDTATTEIYTLSLHDALPIWGTVRGLTCGGGRGSERLCPRSEEHTSELQSLTNLVCRLLLEKKQNTKHMRVRNNIHSPQTDHNAECKPP